MRKADRVLRQEKKDKQNQRLIESVMEEQHSSRVIRRTTKPLEAQTEAQGLLIATILSKDITFITGPAGTGKSYVAVALACEELESHRIDTLIVTRPMQACGENMGFLPGEIEEKYAPWVQPVMDILEERLGKSYVEYLIKTGRVSWQPLQYMRGKSLKHSWVILDEAQNTSPEQMKMFITRIGEGSKLIINGDTGQNDLFNGRGERLLSGLVDAIDRLYNLSEVGLVEFTLDDIVRHGVIKKILRCYG